MRLVRNYWFNQKVNEGTKIIKVGFKRSLTKIIENLRKETYETVVLEDVPVFPSSLAMGLSGVKKLVIHNVGSLTHGALFDLPDLVELEITGSVGYLDSMFVHSCRKLEKITIHANVFSSAKSIIFYYCENMKSVSIQGVFPTYLIHVTDDWNSIFSNTTDEIVSKLPFDNYRNSIEEKTQEEKEEIKQSLLDTSEWVKKGYGRDKFIDYAIGMGAKSMWGFIADLFNSWTRAYKLRKIGWEYSNEQERPSVKTLRISGSYAPDEKAKDIKFYYAPFYTPVFERYRRRFHLWKVAGKGSEIDKMVRLCRWIHESIHHKGDAIPNVRKNLGSLMDMTSCIGKPGNCLIQAICLNEALLSIGIKSRYIKGYQRDSCATQYHVFVCAWSRKMKKWIFLDPTYGAYVMDMEGNILSPAEIRYNLINDIPMIVNEEADYNGDKKMAKTYLKEFLAGNLYHLMSNTISRDSTEDKVVNYQGEWIGLSPKEDKRYYFMGKYTTDESVFWQAPEL